MRVLFSITLSISLFFTSINAEAARRRGNAPCNEPGCQGHFIYSGVRVPEKDVIESMITGGHPARVIRKLAKKRELREAWEDARKFDPFIYAGALLACWYFLPARHRDRFDLRPPTYKA